MPTITVELSAAAAAIIGTALIVLGIDLFLIRRWRHQIGRVRRASEQRAAEEQQRVDAAPVTFVATAWLPYGAPDRPKRAPLLVQLRGTPAWIHEVRLSFGSPDRGARSAEEGLRCSPWEGDMPVRLEAGDDGLELDWPAPRMVEPEPIAWELDVEYSVEREGAKATVVVPGGGTDWQHA